MRFAALKAPGSILLVQTPLRFVHISDTHINPDPAFRPSYAPASSASPLISVSRLLDQLRALPFVPDFVLHTGDVVSDPIVDYYDSAQVLFGTVPAPVYFLPGNHDAVRGVRDILPETVETMPSATLDYTFACQGVQIVCLDSASPAVDHTSRLTEKQLRWVDGICQSADDRPLVVALHHPVLPVGIPWVDERMRLLNGEDFHAVLLGARHRLRGVFFGHIHQNTDVVRDGIHYSSVQSSWYQLHAFPHSVQDMPDEIAQPGFSVVTITPQQTFIRRHSFRVQPARDRAFFVRHESMAG